MNRAPGEAKHTSPVRAMTNPRPAAAPLTAMTTGMSTVSAMVGSTSSDVWATKPSSARALEPGRSGPHPSRILARARDDGYADARIGGRLQQGRCVGDPISGVRALSCPVD